MAQGRDKALSERRSQKKIYPMPGIWRGKKTKERLLLKRGLAEYQRVKGWDSAVRRKRRRTAGEGKRRTDMKATNSAIGSLR